MPKGILEKVTTTNSIKSHFKAQGPYHMQTWTGSVKNINSLFGITSTWT